MADATTKPNVLLELGPGESPKQRLFSLSFAYFLGQRVFLRDSEIVRATVETFSSINGFDPLKIIVFNDWMEVFQDVKESNLVATCFGDSLTGLADRMGLVFFAHTCGYRPFGS